MDWLLYIGAGLVFLLLLSLTPLGKVFRQWSMAKIYAFAQRKYDPYIADRKQRMFREGIYGFTMAAVIASNRWLKDVKMYEKHLANNGRNEIADLDKD